MIDSAGDRWFGAFELALKDTFPHHFAEVGDWEYQVDRSGLTVTVGNPKGAPSVTIEIPPNYLERNAWLLADLLLESLRRMAEDAGFVKRLL
ncbi:MAG: hypothetical protein LAO07_04025 [Acidobacteriia bacterium]|nr:hypothetical protein [Terriglobia bacterium]